MTIVNGGFETGTFSNFRTIGNTSIETAGLGTGPSEGTFQALLTNGVSDSGGSVEQSDLEEFLDLAPGQLDNLGNGDATEGSGIKQTFTANAGDLLTFDFNFLTSEGTPSSFNDFAFFTVNPFVLELADTNSPTFFPTSAVGFNQETGFQTVSVGISQPGTYTLGFGVVDVGDTIVDSGLVVDNIQLTPTGIGTEPEPFELFDAEPPLGVSALRALDAGSGVNTGVDILLGQGGFVGESPLSSSTTVGAEVVPRSPEVVL